MWEEKQTSISEINELLLLGYDVEIDSADGWVGVTEFIDKGEWDEFTFTVDSKTISVNADHLFETPIGWVTADEILSHYLSTGQRMHILTNKNEFVRITSMQKTGVKIPIVDIHVNHPNHRYFANGLSSHNTGCGKSLFMCHHAASTIRSGKNALYITLEMAEVRIAERIDCNLLNLSMDELSRIDKSSFMEKLNSVESKSHGKLVIKEYPTAGAHVGHFKALLDELEMKQNFKPDIIYIDYINICASQRCKGHVN